MKTPKAIQLPSGNWSVRVCVDGKHYRITEATAKRAEAKAAALKAGMREISKDETRLTVGEAVDRYLETRDGLLSPSTMKAYLSYRDHRFGSLINKPICSVTRAIAQNAIKLESKSVGPKTIKNAWNLICAAVKEETGVELPKVVLPPPSKPKGKPVSPEELREIFREVEGTKYDLPLMLDAFLGLRRSELMALRRSDFDFEAGTVTISRALVQNPNGEWIERDRTKTPAGTRTIPVEPLLLEKVKAAPEGRLVTMHPNTIYNYLYKLTKRKGLEHIRIHDFRHTYASVSHLLGVPDKYTMLNGGWSCKPVLDTVYTHTIESERKVFSDRVNAWYKSVLTDNQK